MAMVIFDKSQEGANTIIRLRDLLLEAQNTTEQLQRQIANSTDAQITQLHGVPTEHIVAYKAVMTNIMAVLNDPAVETLLGNVA